MKKGVFEPDEVASKFAPLLIDPESSMADKVGNITVIGDPHGQASELVGVGNCFTPGSTVLAPSVFQVCELLFSRLANRISKGCFPKAETIGIIYLHKS